MYTVHACSYGSFVVIVYYQRYTVSAAYIFDFLCFLCEADFIKSLFAQLKYCGAAFKGCLYRFIKVTLTDRTTVCYGIQRNIYINHSLHLLIYP